MPVPDSVRELIERFTLHGDEYRTGRFNETQLRRDFLDPFFEALGWDVSNKNNYAEAYRDVIHEDAIKIGGATKAPDYCFRIGGTRKFFVEAKKPGVNLKTDALPAYQLRRYGWSAKLPLCILTDFEEFAVYDCRRKPEVGDKASTARTMYIKCADFVEEWEKIAGVFSREAVLKGSFDKYADSTKKKRGTAEVDDAFLAEIETWREKLARNIALRNDLGVRELNHAVQKTIDRLIFLRICEDRGIEDYGRLQALQNGPKVYERLTQLFEAADDRYNSGLFHFHTEKNRTEPPDEWTLTLAIDDKPLKEILRHLYYPDSPYEFSVLPADILGQVYERFLGRVIRLTPGGSAKVEEKPEVRKAGGVYYTPTYIVDYIVENTVGKLLEGAEVKQAERRNRRLDRTLRVLDPACGSGSFLLGAYQYLLDWYLNWYLDHDPEKLAATASPPIYRGVQSAWRLTAAERKRILLDHIYGVDIDPQAVEVTKLSLLLKVLEGETRETVQRQLFAKERALPDLAENIKCGNSLIGSDFYRDKQLALFDEEEQLRINAFDWEVEFKEIMAGGGFDAVIGNPPYIRIQRIGHNQSDYLFSTYETPASKTDLSQLFLERALSLVYSLGHVGFISTSQWLATDYGRKMRGMLSSGYLHYIVDFGSLPVFQNANTYPAVFILARFPAPTLKYKRIDNPDHLHRAAIESCAERSIPFSSLSDSPWNLGKFDVESTLKARGIRYQPLSSYAHAYIGTLTGMDTAFVVTRAIAEELDFEIDVIFPYAYRGEEVSAYQNTYPNSCVIYPYDEADDGKPMLIPEAELKCRAPNVFSYLLGFKEQLRQRKDSRRLYARSSDWYRHLRAGSFNYIRPRKLIIKGIDRRAVVGVLGPDTVFNGANCPAIIPENLDDLELEYFLGLLNSSLISYHLQSVCPAKLGGYIRFNATNVNNAPIRPIDFDDTTDRARHDEMVSLVRQMLDLNEGLAAAKTNHQKTHFQRRIAATDMRIDRLVYELYGLTEEEIRIVEEATG